MCKKWEWGGGEEVKREENERKERGKGRDEGRGEEKWVERIEERRGGGEQEG